MRILGIDPGYATTGFGILEAGRGSVQLLNYGTITTPTTLTFPERLVVLYDDMTQLIETVKPDAVAVEELFWGHNVTTGIGVSHGRGVILLSICKSGAPLFEYTPNQVKQAVVGYGSADKHQVMEMTRRILHMEKVARPDDAADAIAIALCCFPPFSSGQENPGTVYQFNDGFIVGSREKVDLSRFSTSAITEGTYSLDVYTNDEWKGRYDLRIARDKDGRLGVCYTKAMLAQYGIAAEKLNPQLSEQEGYCGSLKSWRNEENVKDNLVQSSLRLNISVPQIYEDQRLKNYVSPEFWDKGITALNLGWMANAWNSHTSSVGGSDNSSAYLGVNAGLSWDGWLLKHIGNLNWQQQQGKAHWNSNQTYLQRPIPQLNSIVSGGQIFTNGEFFDTIGLRGVNLSTDDNMFPDGMRSYAPEIRGVAQSNALVTVRQGSNIIYQTTVPPGPFTLQDVYPSGYGSDLEVSVKEADGSVEVFSVPYASVAQLLRPGSLLCVL